MTSLADSIFNFRVENGRTYHRYKDGKYSYPNDERESDRLDLQHHQFLHSVDGKLGLSPPNQDDYPAKRVLDIGTGTGTWAIEFGELKPEAEVICIDLSPPLASRVPPNVTFEVDDIEEPWTFSLPFDYIHSRMMTSSIFDWRRLIQNAFDNLTPGGYLELQEMDLMPQSDDGSLKPDAAVVRCFALLVKAATVLNRSFQDIPDLVNVMQKIGFVDVSIKKVMWPANTWPKGQHYKLLGQCAHENCMSGIEDWTMAPLTHGLSWGKQEVEVFLIELRKEFKGRRIHAYWPWQVTYITLPNRNISHC
ncbi:methyltransferase domain-containing protein [Colletotrichum abscissum]|uniref:Methyltransferase domain-containing protein n=1 Tax=Colletotrichum abscissum TaxID=1671311 RepID=A0A9P9XBG1_9PEZI|nr:methyltransferase domain-containing protein [Colletotrichum abscissum]